MSDKLNRSLVAEFVGQGEKSDKKLETGVPEFEGKVLETDNPKLSGKNPEDNINENKVLLG